MRQNLAKIAAVSALAVSLLASGGCAQDKTVSRRREAHVNPGAPLSPTVTQDWYELIAKEKDKAIGSDEFLASANSEFLRRPGAAQAELNWVVPVPQTLADGTIVMGYTLRYGDRTALMITPTDKPMNAEVEARSRTIDADVKGNTHPWRTSSVRGTKGLARRGTVQKWQSGDQVEIPSALDWQEPASGPAPYVRYTLVGDVPVGELQSIAAQLTTNK